jgi:hypothetical protein
MIPDVSFVGRLTIIDASRFTIALRSGIGRHRCFGYGMIQLFTEEEAHA